MRLFFEERILLGIKSIEFQYNNMAKIRKEILHIISSFIIIILVVFVGTFAMFSIIHTAVNNTNNNTLFSIIRNPWCVDTIDEPVLRKGDKIVVLRLDDVQAFAWSDISMRMIRDAYSYNAPVVAGVIPETLSEDIRLGNFLKREHCNIEVAIHGWDHLGRPGIGWLGFMTEFGEITYADAKEKIAKGIKELKKYNGNTAPVTFIPPFNLMSNDAKIAAADLSIKIISSIGSWTYDYHTTTFNFDQKRVIPVGAIVSDCEKSFEESSICVIMIHPQDYTNSEKKLDEELYRDYYIHLLEELQKKNVKFATFKQIYSSSQ